MRLYWVVAAGGVISLKAAELDSAHFNVQQYKILTTKVLSTNPPSPDFSQYTGTNIVIAHLVKAASELQLQYQAAGYPGVSVAIAADRITNGVVTMNVFRALTPQILISGKRYPPSSMVLPGQLATSETAPGAKGSSNAPAKPGAPQTTSTPKGFLVRAYEITGDTLLSTNVLMGIFATRVGTNVTVADIMQAASDLQME